MYTGKYRILQAGDNEFVVEALRMVPRERPWPWTKREWVEQWDCARLSAGPMAPRVPTFKSEQGAQKWIDDKRKYPIVVKEPA